MMLIKGLCTCSSSLSKADIQSYTSVLKLAIVPPFVKETDAGMYKFFFYLEIFTGSRSVFILGIYGETYIVLNKMIE